MKFLAVLAATLLPFTAMANTFTVGADLGVSQQANIRSEIYHDTDSTQPAGRVFAEYDAGLFAIGAGYTVFTRMDFHSALVDEVDKLRIHGPELYGKVKYNFDGIEPFMKLGTMYAMAEGSNMWLQDNSEFIPVVGAGVNWHVSDSIALKVGYDRYVGAYDMPPSGLKSDVDFFHMGFAVKI